MIIIIVTNRPRAPARRLRPWFKNGEGRLVQPPLSALKRIEIGSVVVFEASVRRLRVRIKKQR